ncbi:ABC transporter substrate-binding protein [Microbacterium sp. RD1]|uniref:ABC transporter substrate-binding protein n=1 Tax=Microbacterium sp. RD1 TaxID=3457313 RepID=UPI003FA5C0F3
MIPLVLSASVLAACASPQSEAGTETDAPDAGDPTTVTFATLSVAQVATVLVGQDAGIFEENGIDLDVEFVESAAVIPGLLSGQYDFGYLNAPAVLAARSNGVPVKAVTTTSSTTEDHDGFPIQIVVPTNSAISSTEDLAGLRIATDTLFQLPDLGMRGALLDAGVDPSELEIIEIPFSEMGTALEEGRVDAAVVSEPFGTILREQGLVRDLVSTSEGLPEGTPQSVLVSSEQFISANPDVVSRFQTAVAETLEYAIAHDDEVRALLPTFTQLTPELADEIRFVTPSAVDSAEGWQAWADLLLAAGVVDEEIDASEAHVPAK